MTGIMLSQLPLFTRCHFTVNNKKPICRYDSRPYCLTADVNSIYSCFREALSVLRSWPWPFWVTWPFYSQYVTDDRRTQHCIV